MAINKVVYGNNVLIDLSSDTAEASDVAQGKTFHLKSGTQAIGTALAGLDMDLLWKNASPTSGFNAQTVAIDLSSYKFIHVICRWTTSSNPADDGIQKTSMVGYADYIYGYGESSNRRRFMRSSNTGVYFSNGRSSNSQADSSSCVPEFIYGIK